MVVNSEKKKAAALEMPTRVHDRYAVSEEDDGEGALQLVDVRVAVEEPRRVVAVRKRRRQTQVPEDLPLHGQVGGQVPHGTGIVEDAVQARGRKRHQLAETVIIQRPRRRRLTWRRWES